MNRLRTKSASGKRKARDTYIVKYGKYGDDMKIFSPEFFDMDSIRFQDVPRWPRMHRMPRAPHALKEELIFLASSNLP